MCAHFSLSVCNLTVEVGQGDVVLVDNAQPADPSSCQVEGTRGAEASSANDERRRTADVCLCCTLVERQGCTNLKGAVIRADVMRIWETRGEQQNKQHTSTQKSNYPKKKRGGQSALKLRWNAPRGPNDFKLICRAYRSA